MSISTFSAFYFGLTIDSTNNTINFDEGGPELEAVIDSGTYSYSGLKTAVETALNGAGAETYTFSVNRATRVITISATGSFDLLILSGSSANTPWSLFGFPNTDQTGASTYSGDSASGEQYLNQFILQDYVPPDNFKERRDPSVNESANGDVEVISFGVVRFINMSFKFINDKSQDGKIIKYNPSGVSDAVNFFTKITTRGVFEFMPDISDRDTFFEVVVEEMPGSRTGTGYQLRELTDRSLPGYYEINNVRLRVVE